MSRARPSFTWRLLKLGSWSILATIILCMSATPAQSYASNQVFLTVYPSLLDFSTDVGASNQIEEGQTRIFTSEHRGTLQSYSAEEHAAIAKLTFFLQYDTGYLDDGEQFLIGYTASMQRELSGPAVVLGGPRLLFATTRHTNQYGYTTAADDSTQVFGYSLCQ